ncbi:intramembrane metalloprotease PrsW [Paenibacillus albiflavus]|uniref:Protease PrsW n=1 Tax=Paenibacillus albiflavus TaxID=2545760 RepID=A0A4R4ES16_9BACL|nr:glutamic-type intramembrane protease PrsW [Paenibacillus albiflavus]TCZ81238.1 intramembrane metalloprotease PrsW [Paenibacillus albiflavus]
MQILSIIMAAIAPGLSLLAFFYLKDRYETEPIHLVVKVFLLGALLVFPSMILQNELLGIGKVNDFVFSFVITSGIEEFLKFFLLYHMIFHHKAFDEPYDGIVYAVSISLGFATLENIFYALFNSMTFTNLLVRALLPVSGHALFGVSMGYYMGKAKFEPSKKKIFLFLSLLVAVFWHGLFDYIMLVATNYWMWIMIPFMIILWLRTMWKVEQAHEHSPFRVFHREEKVKLS